MLTTWSLLDPADLDATVEAWLRLSVPLVRAQRTASASLASAYIRAFRAFEAPGGDLRVIVPPPLPADQAFTSLTVTGPATVRSATARGVPLDQATRIGQATSARSAMRLALDAGRQTILDTVRADSQAVGWARATSGNPCAFCDMLAARGPAYSEDSVGFQAHDGCACAAEPVYDRDAAWPPGAREARDLWDESTTGLSGNDALNAFRRARAAS